MPLRGSRFTRRRTNPLAGRLRDIEVATRKRRRKGKRPREQERRDRPDTMEQP